MAAVMTLSHTYTISALRDQARDLVKRGAISPQQRLYVLCEQFSDREWEGVLCELERYDYLPCDPICDLIGDDLWIED